MLIMPITKVAEEATKGNRVSENNFKSKFP